VSGPYTTPLLDAEFDDSDSASMYLAHIVSEIRSTGRFVSGIDVEPNFNNGLTSFFLKPERRLETIAAKRQRQWETHFTLPFVEDKQEHYANGSIEFRGPVLGWVQIK
jgi:hypothetical protein